MKQPSIRRAPHVMLLALAGIATVPALAGQPDLRSHPVPLGVHQAEIHREGRDVRASEMLGREVRGLHGEPLGEVKDLVIDVRSGRVHYAVLSFSHRTEAGDKLFAFPLNALRFTPHSDDLTLGVDAAQLRMAPGFDPRHWPDWNRPDYVSQLDRFYGAPPSARRDIFLERMSRLMGRHVDDRDGHNAGRVADIVVNMASGEVRYVVLNFDKAWSLDDKLMPVPLRVVEFPVNPKKDLKLVLTRQQLDWRRGFEDDRWPDLNDPHYRHDVDQYLQSFGSTRPRG
jgi:sporulation protein YlmC with PRC-barrel domain